MSRPLLSTVPIALLVTTLGAFALAQNGHPADQTDAGAMPMAECQEMRQHMERMGEMMKTMDQTLDEKAEVMNSASGEAKITAMAEVINELVAQREHMHEKMARMHKMMMGHMAEHMQMGMNEEGRQGMMNCPMMKRMMQDKPMGDMHGQSQGGHEGHAMPGREKREKAQHEHMHQRH